MKNSARKKTLIVELCESQPWSTNNMSMGTTCMDKEWSIQSHWRQMLMHFWHFSGANPINKLRKIYKVNLGVMTWWVWALVRFQTVLGGGVQGCYAATGGGGGHITLCLFCTITIIVVHWDPKREYILHLLSALYSWSYLQILTSIKWKQCVGTMFLVLIE